MLKHKVIISIYQQETCDFFDENRTFKYDRSLFCKKKKKCFPQSFD